MRNIFKDPLLLKEVRTRMRSKTAVVVENLYIVGICAVVFWIYLARGGFSDALGSTIGEAVFQTITYYQVLLLLLVGPLIAASSITGEKELKTFDSLSVTPVTHGQIVRAKLLASMAYFFMLILVSLPLACMSFILGGVAPLAILKAYLLTFLYVAVAGSVGLYWSTRFQRSIASIPAASICILVAVGVLANCEGVASGAVSLMSPLVALPALYEGSSMQFLGKTCPFWIPCAVLLPLAFCCSTTATVIRLRFDKERRYVLLRFFEFAFFLAIIAFMIGSEISGRTDYDIRFTLSSIFASVLFVMLLLAPWFGASLKVARSETPPPGTRGLSVKRLFRGLFLQGPLFMGLLLVGGAIVIGIGLNMSGKSVVSRRFIWAVYFGVIGLSVAAAALLALRLSDRKTAKERWIGLGVAYLLVGIIVIAPTAVLTYVVDEEIVDTAPVALQYTALLSPATHVAQLGERNMYDEIMPDIMRCCGKRGAVLMTTGFYALACLLLTLPAFRRRKR